MKKLLCLTLIAIAVLCRCGDKEYEAPTPEHNTENTEGVQDETSEAGGGGAIIEDWIDGGQVFPKS